MEAAARALVARCVHAAGAVLGETPVWSAEEQCLYWIDVGHWPAAPPAGEPAAVLHRFDPAGGRQRRWALPQAVGSFALEEGGTALLALADGLYRLDLASEQLSPVLAAPYDTNSQRFNDGRCDPAGRFFWVGTAQRPDPALPAGVGALYCFDGETLRMQMQGVSAANGLAFSPDSRTMYFSDSRQRTVWAFDYDVETGRLGERRVFVQVEPGIVLDGAAVDVEGGYWIALYNGGKVVRYRPDGRLDLEIPLPVQRPTMVAFGGAELQTLYVTSASHRLSAAERAAQPLAGGLFSVDVGVRGVREPRFHGRPRAA